ncbi:MAG: hypothetical protein ACFFB5_03435 [Promethearchaeota archaeon]
MEIEYQNKYVVTWCLDRDGPRICLRVITREDENRTIEIISEDFILELEDEEARDFLNILNQMEATSSIKPVTKYPEYETPEIEEEPLVEAKISSEVAPEIEEPVIPEIAPKVVESGVAEVVPEEAEIISPEVPDSAEIIQFLKQSEQTYSEITSSSQTEDSVEEQTQLSDEIDVESIQEEAISDSAPIQKVSEEVATDIETASFFQDSVSKSPLEMILEEDQKKEEIVAADSSSLSEQNAEETSDEYPETKVIYTPDDLQTESFFSKFDTSRTVDLLQKTEPESESAPEPKRVVELEPTPKFVKKEPTLTEAERRAAIEKERAERKRRLWELTRGF